MHRNLTPLPSHQKQLDFSDSAIWKQLEAADQVACRQLLSRFLIEWLLAEREEQHVPESPQD